MRRRAARNSHQLLVYTYPISENGGDHQTACRKSREGMPSAELYKSATLHNMQAGALVKSVTVLKMIPGTAQTQRWLQCFPVQAPFEAAHLAGWPEL